MFRKPITNLVFVLARNQGATNDYGPYTNLPPRADMTWLKPWELLPGIVSQNAPRDAGVAVKDEQCCATSLRQATSKRL